MQLPGLFIEYLVIGAITLIWVLPLLTINTHLIPLKEYLLLLYIPMAYVIGMLIDFIGYLLLRPIRQRLRRKVNEKYGVQIDSSAKFYAQLHTHSIELAKLVDMYSSRDRIARGTAITSLFATIALVIRFWRIDQWDMVYLTGVCGLALFCAFSILWARYQKLSYDLDAYCLSELDKKSEEHRGEKQSSKLSDI